MNAAMIVVVRSRAQIGRSREGAGQADFARMAEPTSFFLDYLFLVLSCGDSLL